MNSRQNTLHKITAALREQVAMPFPQEHNFPLEFVGEQDNVLERFSKEFTSHQGKLIMCEGREALLERLQALVVSKQWNNISCRDSTRLEDFQITSLPFINQIDGNEIEVGITGCECLVARTGSVVLSAGQNFGRTSPVSVPVHLVIATTKQLVYDINDAIALMQQKYEGYLPSALFFASGPSRTGDIERTLVIGVHGPVEVYIFLMNDL